MKCQHKSISLNQLLNFNLRFCSLLENNKDNFENYVKQYVCTTID